MTMLTGTWTPQRFARGSFMRGVASAFDLRGNTRRQYRWYWTPEDVDRRAVESDWLAVGDDLRTAVARYTAGR
jgi:predicted RNA-binding Zn ribbon-like protein